MKLVEGEGYFRKIVYMVGAIIYQSTVAGGKNCFSIWVQERLLSCGNLQFGTGEEGQF